MLLAVHGLTLMAAVLDPVDRTNWLKVTAITVAAILLIHVPLGLCGGLWWLLGFELALVLGVTLSTVPLALTGWRLERVDSRVLDARHRAPRGALPPLNRAKKRAISALDLLHTYV